MPTFLAIMNFVFKFLAHDKAKCSTCLISLHVVPSSEPLSPLFSCRAWQGLGEHLSVFGPIADKNPLLDSEAVVD